MRYSAPSEKAGSRRPGYPAGMARSCSPACTSSGLWPCGFTQPAQKTRVQTRPAPSEIPPGGTTPKCEQSGASARRSEGWLASTEGDLDHGGLGGSEEVKSIYRVPAGQQAELAGIPLPALPLPREALGPRERRQLC